MKIIQVVGYKNSGKTTTVLALLQCFQDKGIRTASLKHHGHGGLPVGLEVKDSTLHKQAGAIVAGVEGEGMVQFMKSEPWKLEDLVSVYQLWKVELLVIEGFKHANFEKIVIIRDKSDLHLLNELSDIVAVITALPLKNLEVVYPVFHPNEQSNFIEWVTNIWYKK